jgi:uncharacterized protein
MAKDYIGYEALADHALRSVVREALRSVLKRGLVGSHHFYITFKTQYPGVEMPDFLRERYPEEITIVLQNQFSGLRVEDESFDVTLSFQKIPSALHVPFGALTAFVDPGVQFGLQFKGGTAPPSAAKPVTALPAAKPVPALKAVESAEPKTAETQVVSLDKFRKK